MNSYVVKEVRSDEIYRRIMGAPMEKKDDIYRYELMKEFEKKWAMYHCPLKAKQPGGYDVIMVSGRLGYLLPQKIGEGVENLIQEFGDEMAKMQNFIPAGMLYCAGYSCGYHMVKYYLEKTGKSIAEATILPAEEILREIEGFWECE